MELTEKRMTDPAYYRALDGRFHLLGEFLEETVDAAETLAKNAELTKKAAVDAELIVSAPTAKEAFQEIEIPEIEDDLLRRYYRLLLLLPCIPETAEKLAGRGFSEEEIIEIMSGVLKAVRASKNKYQETGLRPMYFGWLGIYARGEIFHIDRFQFQVNRLTAPVVYFRNRSLGTSIAMAAGGTFHRSGRMLGSAGCLDEQDAFTPEITETETSYEGCITVNHGESVSRTAVSLLKSDWEPVLRTGDPILNIHISSGAEIRPEHVLPIMQEAMNIVKKRYPDWDPKTIYCSSWLLDPTIRELVGEESNIVRFGDLFTRFPRKSDGKEIFSFVFPVACRELPPEKWPANTRLERALADRYAHGGFVMGYGGAVLKDEIMR